MKTSKKKKKGQSGEVEEWCLKTWFQSRLGLLVLSFCAAILGELDTLCCRQNIYYALLEYCVILYVVACMSACLPSSKLKVLYTGYLQHLCTATSFCFSKISYNLYMYFILSSLSFAPSDCPCVLDVYLSFGPWSRSAVKWTFRRQAAPKSLVIASLPDK